MIYEVNESGESIPGAPVEPDDTCFNCGWEVEGFGFYWQGADEGLTLCVECLEKLIPRMCMDLRQSQRAKEGRPYKLKWEDS